MGEDFTVHLADGRARGAAPVSVNEAAIGAVRGSPLGRRAFKRYRQQSEIEELGAGDIIAGVHNVLDRDV